MWDTDSSEFNLHIVFPGAGTISRRDNISFSYELEADITTGDTLAFLNKIGNAGDQTNVVANIYETAALQLQALPGVWYGAAGI